MRVFLAGNAGIWQTLTAQENSKVYRLDSMIYAVKQKNIDFTTYKDFILDSGAFTFMKTVGRMNWEHFADSYADFILQQNVRHYIELDLDYVIGVEESRKLRKRIENRVRMPSIPCWHLARGKQEWIDMVKHYNYVSISVSGSDFIPTSSWLKYHKYKPLTWFLEVAKDNGCNVHGLGFTKTTMLERFKFYSVDSTSWVKQSAYGTVVRFNGRTIEIAKKGDPKTQRGKYIMIREHNFKEWRKFQDYAESNL
jgi:hypothetical protein